MPWPHIRWGVTRWPRTIHPGYHCHRWCRRWPQHLNMTPEIFHQAQMFTNTDTESIFWSLYTTPDSPFFPPQSSKAELVTDGKLTRSQTYTIIKICFRTPTPRYRCAPPWRCAGRWTHMAPPGWRSSAGARAATPAPPPATPMTATQSTTGTSSTRWAGDTRVAASFPCCYWQRGIMMTCWNSMNGLLWLIYLGQCSSVQTNQLHCKMYFNSDCLAPLFFDFPFVKPV